MKIQDEFQQQQQTRLQQECNTNNFEPNAQIFDAVARESSHDHTIDSLRHEYQLHIAELQKLLSNYQNQVEGKTNEVIELFNSLKNAQSDRDNIDARVKAMDDQLVASEQQITELEADVEGNHGRFAIASNEYDIMVSRLRNSVVLLEKEKARLNEELRELQTRDHEQKFNIDTLYDKIRTLTQDSLLNFQLEASSTGLNTSQSGDNSLTAVVDILQKIKDKEMEMRMSADVKFSCIQAQAHIDEQKINQLSGQVEELNNQVHIIERMPLMMPVAPTTGFEDVSENSLSLLNSFFGVEHLSVNVNTLHFAYPVVGVIVQSNRLVCALQVRRMFDPFDRTKNSTSYVMFFLVDSGAPQSSITRRAYNKIFGDDDSRILYIQNSLFHITLSESVAKQFSEVNIIGSDFLQRFNISTVISPHSAKVSNSWYRVFYLTPFELLSRCQAVASLEVQSVNVREKICNSFAASDGSKDKMIRRNDAFFLTPRATRHKGSRAPSTIPTELSESEVIDRVREVQQLNANTLYKLATHINGTLQHTTDLELKANYQALEKLVDDVLKNALKFKKCFNASDKRANLHDLVFKSLLNKYYAKLSEMERYIANSESEIKSVINNEFSSPVLKEILASYKTTVNQFIVSIAKCMTSGDMEENEVKEFMESFSTEMTQYPSEQSSIANEPSTSSRKRPLLEAFAIFFKIPPEKEEVHAKRPRPEMHDMKQADEEVSNDLVDMGGRPNDASDRALSVEQRGNEQMEDKDIVPEDGGNMDFGAQDYYAVQDTESFPEPPNLAHEEENNDEEQQCEDNEENAGLPNYPQDLDGDDTMGEEEDDTEDE